MARSRPFFCDAPALCAASGAARPRRTDQLVLCAASSWLCAEDQPPVRVACSPPLLPAEVQGVSNSWASSTQYKFGPLESASDPVRWFTSVYFAFSGLVTAMYGDVLATTVPEMATILVTDVLTLW